MKVGIEEQQWLEREEIKGACGREEKEENEIS